MKFIFLLVSLTVLSNCVSKYRNQIELVKFYDSASLFIVAEENYKYMEVPPDSTYGYSPDKAIKVAFRADTFEIKGPQVEHFYLSHLKCQCGGKFKYFRMGSCCPRESEHGFMGTAMLDIYKLKCLDCREKNQIYLNMYDDDKVYAPVKMKLTR
jgi:hypothetical protein